MNIYKDKLKLQEELDIIEKINEDCHEYDTSKELIWQQITDKVSEQEKKHMKARWVKAVCFLFIILCIPTSIYAAKKLPILNDFITSDVHNMQKKYGAKKSSVATLGDYRARIENSFISKDSSEGTLLLSFVPKNKKAPTLMHLLEGGRASDKTYQEFGVYAEYKTKKGKTRRISASTISYSGINNDEDANKKKDYLSIKYKFDDDLRKKKEARVYCTLYHSIHTTINTDEDGDGKADDSYTKVKRKEHGRLYLPEGTGYPIYEIYAGKNTLRISPMELTVTGNYSASIGENPANYKIYYKNGKKKTLDTFTIGSTETSYSDPDGERLNNTYSFGISDLIDISTIDRIKLDTTTFKFSKKKNVTIK